MWTFIKVNLNSLKMQFISPKTMTKSIETPNNIFTITKIRVTLNFDDESDLLPVSEFAEDANCSTTSNHENNNRKGEHMHAISYNLSTVVQHRPSWGTLNIALQHQPLFQNRGARRRLVFSQSWDGSTKEGWNLQLKCFVSGDHDKNFGIKTESATDGRFIPGFVHHIRRMWNILAFRRKFRKSVIETQVKSNHTELSLLCSWRHVSSFVIFGKRTIFPFELSVWYFSICKFFYLSSQQDNYNTRFYH